MDIKEFSVIIPFYNSELYLADAIDSIINQTLDFKNHIQLILIDDGSNDESVNIAKEYVQNFPENIILFSQENKGVANSRNLALEYATGKYVCFLDSDDKLSENTLKNVVDAFLQYDVDVVAIPVSFFERVSTEPSKFSLTGVIDLNQHPERYLASCSSSFFKKDSIGDLKFDEDLICSEENIFLNKILLKSNKYAYIDNSIYYYRRRSNYTAIRDNINLKKEYYNPRIKNYFIELINFAKDKYGFVPDFINYLIIKHFEDILLNQNISELLQKDEILDIFNDLEYILSFIGIDLLRKIPIDKELIGFLIAVKNKDIDSENIKYNKPSNKIQIKNENENLLLVSKSEIIADLSKDLIFLDFATLRDGVLSFSGYFKTSFNKENLEVFAIKEYSNGNNEVYNGSYYNYPTRSTQQILTFDWGYVYNFDLFVPISDKNENSSIKLKINYNYGNKTITKEPEVIFRQFCNISYMSHYYVKEDMIIMFNGKFNVMPYSYLKMIKYEIRGLLNIFKKKEMFYKQAMFFRLTHLILYPLMKNKEIWIIMDRKDVADDNAEHFYKYAIKQNDGIKKFFSIFENSPDFSRIQKLYGNVLPFESKKHRFYYSFADKIISSQGSEFYLNPFRHRNYPQTAGISNVDFYFLQHGIIKDNMSSWLRKYDRNPKLIVTSTELEYKSLFDEGYNYGDKVIQLLGLPRYDNLDNKGYKKQIVIMPSWRNYLVDEEIFLKSEYFKRFNSLVNNEKLINHAKNNGYELVFKPHPELVKYLDLFDKNDSVQIDQFKKYQEVFNESALLITDYSSIFFDFSYLKKPLIYYQYGNDYHYDSENGYFNYESMGFGPVIKDEEELINKIIEYIDNDCVMENIYKKRVDDFFKYHDHNNSKRCYDWIYNH